MAGNDPDRRELLESYVAQSWPKDLPAPPQGFATMTARFREEAGLLWFAGLPLQMRTVARDAGLTYTSFMEGGAVSPTFAATTRDGREVVVKFIPPWSPLAEIDALRDLQGHGAVALVASDHSRGVIVSERLRPGTPASGLDEVAQVMRQIHLPVQATTRDYPRLGSEIQFRIDRALSRCNEVPGEDVKNAERRADASDLGRVAVMAAHLARSADPAREVLLHGDALPKNLLEDQKRGGLAAIDPRPCIGDREFDIATFAVTAEPGAGVEEKIATLCDRLGADPQRALKYALVIAATEVPLAGRKNSGPHHDFMRRHIQLADSRQARARELA